MKSLNRRDFVKTGLIAGSGFATFGSLAACSSQNVTAKPGAGMQLGLVTYLWGQDWDLPTLIRNCQESKVLGVELRTQHAHGVEPSLSAAEREDVKKRFADSAVTCLGYGSNQEYHSPDPDRLKQQIEDSYELVKLCHDIGASGLKVKPNTLPEGVEPEKTITQIAQSLDKVGKFAQDYGQEIRVEVHGHLTQLPANMKAIFDQVTEPNVKVCWNCNDQDLVEPGLEYNFNMLKGWFGETVHIRELNVGDYPYQQLLDLFVGMDYNGWILLEARTKPDDRVVALKEQKAVFDQMIANAQEKL
jgi:sugar phosphate isomerase/epimerase